jgi:multicomponent Na+:H+ antiporter subunit A
MWLGVVLLILFGGSVHALSRPEIWGVSAGYPWAPSLGMDLSFLFDELSLVFAALIAGIGFLIVVYSRAYLHGHPHLRRFILLLGLFSGSMLGVVLSNNLLMLYVFWELTSIASFFLIGFEHKKASARAAALQALLVTSGGGLPMLAGFVLIGQIAGTFRISELVSSTSLLTGHALYPAVLAMIVLGAFTKSAQIPFHFWLPNAMQAPTPVSAYLHSATMVKAGVFLLLRLQPVLGGTAMWFYLLTVVGGLTMVAAAYFATRETDLKRILAYSTVSALGIFVFLTGIGTPEALRTALLFVVAHALYKGALFLVTGIVDHETGVRDVRRLGSLGRTMPITAAAAVLAGASMAGLPPFIGFTAKEHVYEAAAHAPFSSLPLTAAWFLAAALTVTVALIATLKAFFFGRSEIKSPAYDPGFGLLAPPVLLSVTGLALGLRQSTGVQAIGIAGIAAGVLLYLVLWRVAPAHPEQRVAAFSERAYDRVMAGMNALARLQTQTLQSGYLRIYLSIVVVTILALTTTALIRFGGVPLPAGANTAHMYEIIVCAFIVAAAAVAARSESRFRAVAALGLIGYGVAAIYIFFGAPDLALTQFLVETLIVVLFVLVFRQLPRIERLSGYRTRLRDFAIAGGGGVLMAALTLAAGAVRSDAPISSYFNDQSVPAGHGRNVVNVILVDFRALDTLGEITVLAIASLGVYALLKFNSGRRNQT